MKLSTLLVTIILTAMAIAAITIPNNGVLNAFSFFVAFLLNEIVELPNMQASDVEVPAIKPNKKTPSQAKVGKKRKSEAINDENDTSPCLKRSRTSYVQQTHADIVQTETSPRRSNRKLIKIHVKKCDSKNDRRKRQAMNRSKRIQIARRHTPLRQEETPVAEEQAGKPIPLSAQKSKKLMASTQNVNTMYETIKIHAKKCDSPYDRRKTQALNRSKKVDLARRCSLLRREEPPVGEEKVVKAIPLSTQRSTKLVASTQKVTTMYDMIKQSVEKRDSPNDRCKKQALNRSKKVDLARRGTLLPQKTPVAEKEVKRILPRKNKCPVLNIQKNTTLAAGSSLVHCQKVQALKRAAKLYALRHRTVV